jgi:hypothetical protein
MTTIEEDKIFSDAWNKLDELNEHDTVKLNALYKNMEEILAEQEDKNNKDNVIENNIKDDDGFKISFPINDETLSKILKMYETGKKLCYQDSVKLINHMKILLIKDEKNTIINTKTPVNGKIIIVGGILIYLI